jgi:hypothetical protein
MYINFKTLNYRGCINLETNDLYLSHVSPRYRRTLGTTHVTYDTEDKNIAQEVHEAVKELNS